MATALVATALLMGLAGGPHCAAMCGAACAGVVSVAPMQAGMREVPARPNPWPFHAGRLAGYTLAGAVAAQALGSFAWLSTQAAALRPLWLVMHLVVLGWGLTLLMLARQPAWVANAGRSVWGRVRPQSGRGQFSTGMLWAFMPCGLLWSALLVASLTGNAAEGALAMALFALGSGVPLALAPGLLQRLRRYGDGLRRDWGTRASGLVLALAAVWGLWMDVASRVAEWCAT